MALTAGVVFVAIFCSCALRVSAIVTPIETAVSEVCLGCICQAVSKCNATIGCSDGDCGMFRITKPYWIDAGKPTISLDNSEDDGAFSRCANDPVCAANTVRQYMSKFTKDCNRDGAINCLDFAAIHTYGGYADDCTIPLDKDFLEDFQLCINQIQGIDVRGSFD